MAKNTSAKNTTSGGDTSDSSGRRRLFSRLFRVSIFLILLASAALGIGSVFIRAEVIRLVRERTLTSSSLVMSSPVPLARGTLFKGQKVPARLQRLGYQTVQGKPERPGEVSESARSVLLYLRGGKFGESIEQSPSLVRLVLGDDDSIQSVQDDSSGKNLTQAYLEPEVLSRLGDSATRASIPKKLTEYPQTLIDAIISIEDERYYRHYGIDPIGIARAIAANLAAGHTRQGGSTLTQQLAKNLFLTPARTLARKAKEALAAVCLETAFTKDQILELYMNEVFLGQEGNVAVHGFGEAARTFFGKDVKDITLAEAATLAGINKAPTTYSPRLNADDALERRKVVLAKMLELGKITAGQRAQAEKEKINVLPAERSRRVAPYFIDHIRGQVGQIIDTSHWDDTPLRIVTGLDIEYQQCAESAVAKGLKQLETKYARLTKGAKPLQSAFIAVNPIRGDVLAWVGGRDYGQNQFDRVFQSKRQPGSTFKPFVYLTGLDKDLNSYRVARTTTILMDEPVQFEIPGSQDWEPKNFDERFRGSVTVREALTNSLNVPTVELAQKVGIESVARTAALFGFGENLPRVPSLALGAGEVSPFGLARAYSALANGGLLLDLTPIQSIVEADTRAILFSPRTKDTPVLASSGLPAARGMLTSTPYGTRAASEAAVYVLTTILRSAIDQGTGRVVRQLGFTAPAAGKTGTSNDSRDAWFAGFTPKLLAVVWIGFDDNKELKLTGGQAAAPIWAEFMKCVAPMEPPLDFVPPPGVVFREIDRTTGLLFTDACNPADRMTEVFVEDTEPVTACTHGGEPLRDELPLLPEESADYAPPAPPPRYQRAASPYAPVFEPKGQPYAPPYGD